MRTVSESLRSPGVIRWLWLAWLRNASRAVFDKSRTVAFGTGTPSQALPCLRKRKVSRAAPRSSCLVLPLRM